MSLRGKSSIENTMATVYTYKIEQNGALQFKNNGEKYQYPYIKHTHLSKTAHSLAPFKANTDVPQTSY